MKNRKEIIIGVIIGYIMTSYWNISFPSVSVWFCIVGLLLCFFTMRFYWKKINQDILD